MAVLVTGGAGYIGSVTVELLRAQGESVVVLDNLSRGHRAAVAAGMPFYVGDIGDDALIKRIAGEHDIEACLHFAAFAYVGESVAEPKLYFENNVGQGLRLLDALIRSNIKRLVFSSTCATYGEPQSIPITESHPQQPTNPYGWSKFFMERMLESYHHAYGLRSVTLRYFNVAGAIENRGEHHDPEPHLLPIVLGAAEGKLPFVTVFGGDYPTPDGTCVRDYIHVSDLGDAHIRALNYLRDGGDSTHVNLGNGQGYSVLEVIEAARRVTGKAIEARLEAQRPGDPSRLIADASKAFQLFGWRPAHPELEAMIRTAWEWRLAHPKGYEERN
ncbi:MAG: UDP-glucose 4-epimerase GalE [Pyrinomonadaceae bacterium]